MNTVISGLEAVSIGDLVRERRESISAGFCQSKPDLINRGQAAGIVVSRLAPTALPFSLTSPVSRN